MAPTLRDTESVNRPDRIDGVVKFSTQNKTEDDNSKEEIEGPGSVGPKEESEKNALTQQDGQTNDPQITEQVLSNNNNPNTPKDDNNKKIDMLMDKMIDLQRMFLDERNRIYSKTENEIQKVKLEYEDRQRIQEERMNQQYNEQMKVIQAHSLKVVSEKKVLVDSEEGANAIRKDIKHV